LSSELQSFVLLSHYSFAVLNAINVKNAVNYFISIWS